MRGTLRAARARRARSSYHAARGKPRGARYELRGARQFSGSFTQRSNTRHQKYRAARKISLAILHADILILDKYCFVNLIYSRFGFFRACMILCNFRL